MYTSTVQSSHPSANAALPPHPRPQISYPRLPILYLLPLLPHHRSLLLAVLLLSLTFSEFFNGMLEVFEPGALNYFTFFRVILLTLFVFRNPILTHFPLFRIPGFSALLSDRTNSWSGILSCDATHASRGVIIFVRQGLSFSELSISSLSLLNPYSDYVGVNISLNNSSSVSFFNVYVSPIRSSSTDGRTDSFSPSILPSSRNLFIMADFNCHHPLWDSRGTSDPRGEEVFNWVISFDLLPLNGPDTTILLHRSSPDISFAPSSLALSYSSEVLQDLDSDHLSIFLSVPLSLSLSLWFFAPTSVLLPSTFRNLAGMALPPTLIPAVLLQKNARLFPPLLLSLLLWH